MQHAPALRTTSYIMIVCPCLLLLGVVHVIGFHLALVYS